jgi:hypothetical protein
MIYQDTYFYIIIKYRYIDILVAQTHAHNKTLISMLDLQCAINRLSFYRLKNEPKEDYHRYKQSASAAIKVQIIDYESSHITYILL